MNYGKINLSRKSFATDPLWLKPRVFSEWEAWIDLLQMAAWHPIKRDARGTTITLQRGEFVASLRYLSQRWRWTVKRIRVGLKRAQVDGRIRAQSETVLGMIYHIVNYDLYQDGGPVVDERKGTAENGSGAQQGHSEGTNRRSNRDSTHKEIPKRNGSIPHDTLTDEPSLQWE